jgi:RNA polymerase sigma factor (sigma-70 family)
MANYSNSPLLFRNNVDRQRYYRFVRWTCGDHATAEELFQDANAKAFKYYGDSEELWNNAALLSKLDRNVFNTWYRRRKLRTADYSAVSLDDESIKGGVAETLDDRLAEWLGTAAVAYKQELFRELQERLERISPKLPAMQRAILESRELSITELAEKLGTSRGSVKTQLGKLRRRLRDDVRLHGLALELLNL